MRCAVAGAGGGALVGGVVRTVGGTVATTCVAVVGVVVVARIVVVVVVVEGRDVDVVLAGRVARVVVVAARCDEAPHAAASSASVITAARCAEECCTVDSVETVLRRPATSAEPVVRLLCTWALAIGLLGACGTAGHRAARTITSQSARPAATARGTAPASTTTVGSTTTTTTTPVTQAPTTSGVTAAPAATGYATTLTAVDVANSWRPGCPVGPAQLRMLHLPYWGFDGRARVGRMVVNAAVAQQVVEVFASLFAVRFPIRSMVPVDVYGGSDPSSMAADNTSGFNCRPVDAPGPVRWSVHAYGEAIDVNPVENPYLVSGRVEPTAGSAYLDRADVRPGMAGASSALNRAFASVGWHWGGHFSAPDYQHFSSTGG